jgi:hypothetical protein
MAHSTPNTTRRPTLRILLDANATDRTLDRIAEQVDILRRAHRNLRDHRRANADGYPTQSMGGGGSPTNEVDDDGTPIPQHSDPVGRLVVTFDTASDAAGIALVNLTRHIRDASLELEAAIGDVARLTPPVKITDPDQLWCENCLRAGIREPREAGRKVCRWCREETADHGRRPSPRLVHAHARGTRITPTLRRELLLRDAEDRKANRGKAKRAS